MEFCTYTLFLFIQSFIKPAMSCIATTTQRATTTTTLCCPPLSTNNPPRVNAPAGSVGALDECAVLRRIQHGMCPLQAQLVCLPSKGSTVRRVVLQFINGTTVILVIQDPSRAVGVIVCTGSGWRVSVNGVLQPFTAVSCTQETVEGPSFVDYYNEDHDGRGKWWWKNNY